MAGVTVSVVTPAFNVAEFVHAAVLSVVEQSFRDWEMIVVDDGSTDRTAEAVSAISDKRIRLIRQSNHGSSHARNHGIEASSGRYVAFLDGDDLWLPDKLQVQTRWLDSHPETDMVYSRALMVREDGSDAGRALLGIPGDPSFADLMREDTIGNGSSSLVRREALDRAGRFDTELAAGVDHDLWLRIALLGDGNIHGLDHVHTLYRRRPGQISSDWRLKLESWRAITAKMKRLAPHRVPDSGQAAAANLYRVASAIAYESGDSRQALALFAKAVKLEPWYLASDRRSWVQAAALCAAAGAPRRVHRFTDTCVRRARSWLRRP